MHCNGIAQHEQQQKLSLVFISYIVHMHINDITSTLTSRYLTVKYSCYLYELENR